MVVVAAEVVADLEAVDSAAAGLAVALAAGTADSRAEDSADILAAVWGPRRAAFVARVVLIRAGLIRADSAAADSAREWDTCLPPRLRVE